METVVIGAISTALLIWMGWISVFAINTNIKANKSLSNDAMAQKEIQSIVEGMQTMTTELKLSFKELVNEVKAEMKTTNHRLDTFVKDEMDTLKHIAKGK